MYEHYLHYVPAHATKLREFVVNLVTGYCNLCDHLVVPSQSVAQIIGARGVTTPLDVVPTGVYTEPFAKGDGAGFRAFHGISRDGFVAGYVGRLAPEKNLAFLAEAVRTFAGRNRRGHFLVVGSGPSAGEIRRLFLAHRAIDRLHLAGSLEGQELIDAYHAMDVFVFASQSETQGMVLTEAMAAGRPVVAVDAPGVREVVEDGRNGRLLDSQDNQTFAAAIEEMARATPAQATEYSRAARATAEQFSMKKSAQKLAHVYEGLVQREKSRLRDEHPWHRAIEEIKAEWELIRNVAEAASHTFG
jgi:glycosyltransferase involved in cell wall biosynthesis